MNDIQNIIALLTGILAIIGAIFKILAMLGKAPPFVKKFLSNPVVPWVLLLVVLFGYSICLFSPKEVPLARIIEPEYHDGHTVPTHISVVAEYKDIPQNRYLWVVVRIPKVKPTWLVYPQLHSGKIPIQVVGDGQFEITVDLGGNADSGELFNIIILLLNKEANRSFTTYAKDCIAKDICGGIPLPDTGVEILDFTTVIRE